MTSNMAAHKPVERYQVIIAGAGPVGSGAAYRLAQRGISVLLLESKDTCAEDLRASTFHPPTIDMMDALGVLPELEAQGLRAPVYQYRNRRSGEVLPFDLGEIGDVSAHPYRLQCEQFKLARLLTGKLKNHSHGQVKFSRRVVHFEQSPTGVNVNVETPYEIERYECDYLIATDGANSIIRKWLGVEFEGFTYPERFLTLSTEWPLEQHFKDLAYVNYVADPDEWCVLLRVPTLWRVLVPSLDTDTDEELLSDEKKNTVFQGLTGDGKAVKTEHRTLYRVHQRVADRYTHGRVLLAGDAAHLNNPIGGLGMNSGIHDVWNLTDKLTEILLNGANAEPLLARYERQRKTVMQEFVQAQTIANKASMEAKSADAQAAHQAKMEAILADPDTKREYLLTQSMYRSLERAEAIA